MLVESKLPERFLMSIFVSEEQTDAFLLFSKVGFADPQGHYALQDRNIEIPVAARSSERGTMPDVNWDLQTESFSDKCIIPENTHLGKGCGDIVNGSMIKPGKVAFICSYRVQFKETLRFWFDIRAEDTTSAVARDKLKGQTVRDCGVHRLT